MTLDFRMDGSWLSTELARTYDAPKRRMAHTMKYGSLDTWRRKEDLIFAKVQKGLSDQRQAVRDHFASLRSLDARIEANDTFGFCPGAVKRTADAPKKWDALYGTSSEIESQEQRDHWANQRHWKRHQQNRKESMKQWNRDYYAGLRYVNEQLDGDDTAGAVEGGVVLSCPPMKYGHRVATKKTDAEKIAYKRDLDAFLSWHDETSDKQEGGYDFVEDYRSHPNDPVLNTKMKTKVNWFRQHVFEAPMRGRGREYLRTRSLDSIKPFEKDLVQQTWKVEDQFGKKREFKVPQLATKDVKASWVRARQTRERACKATELMHEGERAFQKRLEDLDQAIESADTCGFMEGGSKFPNMESETLRITSKPIRQAYDRARSYEQRATRKNNEMREATRQYHTNTADHRSALDAMAYAGCIDQAEVLHRDRLLVERKLETPYTRDAPDQRHATNVRTRARKDDMASQTRAHMRKMAAIKQLPFDEHMARMAQTIH